MTASLPSETCLNVAALTRVFSATTTSYKLAFFQALMNLISRRDFASSNCSFSMKELAVEMAVVAWYPHTFARLSFGVSDKLGSMLDALDFSTDGHSLANVLSKKKLRDTVDANYDRIGLGSILRYVPYRFLTPFFEANLMHKSDHLKNELICDLATNGFGSDDPPLYRFSGDHSKIEMHPKWLSYIQESFAIVSGWLAHHWVGFLQSRNPNIPAIPNKVAPPAVRSSMKAQLEYWRAVFDSKKVRCIYSDELLSSRSFALDHFIPWSFVCHDQLWNLIPVLPKANSSKGNRLPAIPYIEKFIRLQSDGLRIAKSKFSLKRWDRLTEPFVTDLRLASNDLLSCPRLDESYRNTLTAMLSLAKQTGFPSDWEYRAG